MKKFIRLANKVAVDERCVCGHPKSDHGSVLCCKGNLRIRMANDGSCCCRMTEKGPCPCPHFRWAGWIFSAG